MAPWVESQLPLPSVASSVKWACWMVIALSRADARVTEIKHGKDPRQPPVCAWASANNPSLSVTCASLDPGGTVTFHRLYLLAARLELELASCPPSLGGDVSPPGSCMRPRLGSACSPHAGDGLEPKGISLCFLLTCLVPYPLPARPSSGGWAPGSHKAGHSASDPSQPPHPGSLEGRDYGLHPELAVTHSLSQSFGMFQLEGPWEFSQPNPLVHRQETAPQGL